MSKYIKEYKNFFDENKLDLILEDWLKYCPNLNDDFSIIHNNIITGWEEHFRYMEEKGLVLIKEYLKETYSLLPCSGLKLHHMGFLYDPVGSFTELHYDWEMNNIAGEIVVKPLVLLVYLKDIEEGGSLFFPLEDYTLKAEKNNAALFPSSFAFPHLSLPVLKGAKYLMRLTYMMDLDYYKSRKTEF
jgi:hypothetical protein